MQRQGDGVVAIGPAGPGVTPADGAAPRVTVGVPVYNEARFIEEALDALRAQDHPNLRIVVSDNASTDGTGALCERAAASDPRIEYERLGENIGASANFRRVLAGADGDFFMWAGGHDRWSPNLVSESVAALEANPDAAVAVATSYWMDGDGRPVDRRYGYTDTRGMHPLARFFTVFWGNMHPVLGLMRRRHLDATRGLLSCTGADLILLCDLALRGDFVHVPQASWWRREVRADESHDARLRRYTSADYGLARGWLDRLFPLARLPLELSRVAMAAPLGAPARLTLLLALLASFPVRYVAGRR